MSVSGVTGKVQELKKRNIEGKVVRHMLPVADVALEGVGNATF